MDEAKPEGLRSEYEIAYRIAADIDPANVEGLARDLLRASRDARAREAFDAWHEEWLLMWRQICWHIRLEVYTAQLDRFGPRVLDMLRRLQNQVDNLAVDLRKLERKVR